MIWLTLLPFAAVFIATLIMGQGSRLWISIAITSSALVVGALCLYEIGVKASCEIDESECLGATATAWLIAFVWGAPTLGFILKLATQIRSRGRDDDGRSPSA
ncbi:hypothetical protein RJJ65_02905 [Rhizobium hidalgonense]|uniref:Transmembrane protein n=1 Tax=Rhizobium hidalgonense TaxID=1538159 RepID=A0AAJ2GLD9_9HYPH|nr:hypothetical protein [Rhizobium hidalgonense]MDR9771620.1 hypothetical protein [Rhizobium hidalgonense]MDR9814473.1 hypothetical protein [Rhizobium hidalgonense]MDR9822461.1 hypothetical protein [Rhizobium hidalgonense]PON07720.1 hypothetical protein ATY29_11400 [Rhizobium hidalgonense]QKK23345.1 hypothetical protein FFM81_008270 [Rhizobium hidalgonense]